MSHYKSTTSIEVGILGENVDDWKDGLAHAAKWCRDTAHVLKAHPSLADVALVVTQYTAPGALKTLSTLLRGIGKDEVSGIAQSDCDDHCCNNRASPIS